MSDYIIFENPDNNSLSLQACSLKSNDLLDVLKIIENSEAQSILLTDAEYWKNEIPSLPNNFEEYDLLHTGLNLGAGEAFKTLWFTSMNWLFLNPHSGHCSTSWKATPHWCYLHPDQVRSLGGFDYSYNSAEAVLMDFAYRLLTCGGRVNHYPLETHMDSESRIHFQDEINFIFRRINPKSALYASFWAGLISFKYRRSIKAYLSALKKAKKNPPSDNYQQSKIATRLIGIKSSRKITKYSSVIPTIDRYEYVEKAIKSLLEQDLLPEEIIVVDQTPTDRRRPDFYQKFERDKVKVIFLDQAGQSNARNTGVGFAKNQWCLLFDDDAEARSGMINNHIRVIENSNAGISSGAALAPWKDESYIPKGNRFKRISNILDTGNCFIKKDVFLAVSGLDRVYDHGSGADNDLGVRLYLNGFENILNSEAVHTHYKASKGGLRSFGVIWRTTVKFWGPFPQPTLIYTTQRYYPRKYWFAQYLLRYFTANDKKISFKLILLWILLPLRLSQAIRQAGVLHKKRSVP